MKRTLFSLILGGLVSLALAQSPPGYYLIENTNAGTNPGGLNTNPEEEFGSGLPIDWNVAHFGAVSAPEWTPIQNLPFIFYFDGQPYAQFKVSTSGVLTFSTDAQAVPAGVNGALPAAQLPDKSIAVWGLDGAHPTNRILTKTFGENGSRQFWVYFNAYNYQGGVSGVCKTHWSIVLEEGTNNIYIVDQRKNFICLPTLTAGVQIDASNAIQIPGSPNLAGLAGDDPSQADNSYYTFIPGEQPKRDLEALTVKVADIVEMVDAPITIIGGFNNIGTEALKSFDFNYQLNGGPIQSMHVSGNANLANLEHKIPWIPTVEGEYELRMWVGSPNGLPDQAPTNDTISKMITVIEETPVRKVIVEEATQHNCGPCAAANPAFDALLQANPTKVAPIKYATTFPGANNDWRRLFNPSHHDVMVGYMDISGVPTTVVDGAYAKMHPGSFNQGTIDARTIVPGLFTIEFTESINGSNIDLSVDVTPLVEVDASNLIVHVGLVQDKKVFPTATGTNGEKEFFDIMRYMVPGPSGTPVTATPGVTTTVSGTYAIDPEFRGSVMRVVAWVMDFDSREVYMGDKSTGIYLCPGGNSLTGSITATDATCQGNDGSVGVFASGGTGNLTYLWNTGATTPTLNAVGPGLYTVTVSDGADCEMDFHAEIGQDAPPKLALAAYRETCPGAADGKIDLYIAGGTAPYTFSWSNGATTQDIDQLGPGNYTVTVTDANGCIAPLVGANVGAASGAAITGTSSTPDNGSGNGSASAEAVGGTHPYTFSWDNGMTGQTIEGLSAGNYTVTVTDYYGCSAGTATVTVDSNTSLEEELANAGIETLNLFPNPTAGNLRVQVYMTTMEPLSVQLFDINGRLIFQDQTEAMNYQRDLDLSHEAAGVYTLQLRTSQGAVRQRVIRQ